MSNTTLAPLPFAKDALEPYISSETLEFYYERHYRAMHARTVAQQQGAHDLFALKTLHLRTLGLGYPPQGEILQALLHSFGSTQKFILEAKKCADTLGACFVVLYKDGARLMLAPVFIDGKHPPHTILAWDIFEHAYYADYKDRIDDYIDALYACTNWQKIMANLALYNEYALA